MNTLPNMRAVIRPLLDQNSAADGMVSYYAFHHPDAKTRLFTLPIKEGRTQGYIAVSRTGYDLFRPFVTMRLPIQELAQSRQLINEALPPGAPIIAQVPVSYFPLMQALFHIESARTMELYVLDDGRFRPTINLMVTRSRAANGLPRFTIRNQEGELVTAAALNWQSPRFGEVSIHTKAGYRRQGWGEAVLAVMVEDLLKNGRLPLYVADEKNEASIILARKIGFVRHGAAFIFFQATRRE